MSAGAGAGRTEGAAWMERNDSRDVTVSSPPQVCILAGGRGTRLGARVEGIPKPLLEVAGEPFLIHQLRLLAARGIREVVLCVGYLGDMIVELIGTERFGMSISYSHDRPGLEGTLGGIRRALPLLDERFLVVYGDAYLRIDYAQAAASWRASGLPAMMSVYRNEGRWEVSNAVYDRDRGRVLAYDKWAPDSRMRWIDYGLGGLQRGALELAPAGASDLADLHCILAREGLLHGFEASERFYEIGTPRALAEIDAYLQGLAVRS